MFTSEFNRIRHKTMACTAVLILLLNACATSPGMPGYGATPAEQQMRQQSRLFNRASMEACLLVGGGIGLLTFLASTDKDNALIAALAGCGVGVGANYYVQTRRSQYANNEQRLQAMIADIREDNRRLRSLISTTREVVADDLRKIAALEQAYRDRQISLEAARTELRTVDSNRAYLEQTLANLRERERDWRQIAAQEYRLNPQSPRIGALNREIEQLRNQIAYLQEELDVLANRRIVSPLG